LTNVNCNYNCNYGLEQAVREAATICPAPCKFTFDLLTLKVASESRVTWATFANFSLPRPLCSRVRPDVHDRHIRHASSLHGPTGGAITMQTV